MKVNAVCDTYEQAKEVINNKKEELLKHEWVEAYCNIALAMYNPLNELDYYYYEIQEIEVQA